MMDTSLSPVYALPEELKDWQQAFLQELSQALPDLIRIWQAHLLLPQYRQQQRLWLNLILNEGQDQRLVLTLLTRWEPGLHRRSKPEPAHLFPLSRPWPTADPLWQRHLAEVMVLDASAWLAEGYWRAGGPEFPVSVWVEPAEVTFVALPLPRSLELLPRFSKVERDVQTARQAIREVLQAQQDELDEALRALLPQLRNRRLLKTQISYLADPALQFEASDKAVTDEPHTLLTDWWPDELDDLIESLDLDSPGLDLDHLIALEWVPLLLERWSVVGGSEAAIEELWLYFDFEDELIDVWRASATGSAAGSWRVDCCRRLIEGGGPGVMFQRAMLSRLQGLPAGRLDSTSGSKPQKVRVKHKALQGGAIEEGGGQRWPLWLLLALALAALCCLWWVTLR